MSQADYYHLGAMALYIFSAPHSRVEMTVGARSVWAGETDDTGDLLLDALDCLRPACLDEETLVTLRSHGLRTGFVVRWAPLLQELAVEDEEIFLRFDGPEDTAVRLWLRGLSGKAFWMQDVLCRGEETTARIPLPAARPPLGHLVAGYILSSGETRPAAWQVQVVGEAVSHIPAGWLLEGIGVADLEELAVFGTESLSMV